MPPKIVYGKKKAAVRPVASSYTKFLSPEKDALFTKTKDDTDNEPKQTTKRTEQRIQDELSVLEAQLGGLSIDKEHASHVESSVEKRSKSKTRKVLEDRDANAVSNNTEASKGTHKADMKEAPRVQEPTPTPSSPPRTPIAKQKKKRSKPTTSKKKKAPLPTPEPTPERDDIYTQYAASLLPYSDARRITAFEQWSSELEPLFEVTKIAEASYSEVYRLSAISATTGLKEESVLKLVALKTPPGVPLPCQTSERAIRDREGQMAKEREERKEKDEFKSDIADVLSEVKLLQNLNYIPGFTNFRDLTVLQGRPSSTFNNAWKSWNKSQPRAKKSYFPDPSKKTSYEETQLWAVIEMQDAGIDCEKLMEAEGLGTIWELWDVFWGVCLSVAKAEEACQFEHRDMHMGNICVRSSRPKNNVMQPTIKDPLRRRFKFTGLETTIIDYTLSRADIIAHDRTPDSPSTLSIASPPEPQTFTGHEVAYLDLNNNPALFEADAAEEYQYEIYRYMRGAALYNNPLQSAPSPSSPDDPTPSTPRRSPRKNNHIRFGEVPETPQKPSSQTANHEDTNIWRAFHPKTNLVWLHFLLYRLLSHLKGYEPEHLSTSDIMANVELGDDAAAGSPGVALKVKKRAVKLHKVLVRVSELLCPVALGREGALGSVKELVVLALGERWLKVGDVSG
ncbi:hypothetical protein E8E13_005631 [Curvularia kusanoi]|uniref:non-specific serine/threonine protein kinase n=1 Tax=Curvularia kusanoi TaxID=90978 RepID=A0A9P4WEL5_CURKU|nr:hypothetical protein E8E13_005631 [Curvularia kusanoi]